MRMLLRLLTAAGTRKCQLSGSGLSHKLQTPCLFTAVDRKQQLHSMGLCNRAILRLRFGGPLAGIARFTNLLITYFYMT